MNRMLFVVCIRNYTKIQERGIHYAPTFYLTSDLSMAEGVVEFLLFVTLCRYFMT